MKTYFEKIIDSNNFYARWAFILLAFLLCLLPLYKIGKIDGNKINFTANK